MIILHLAGPSERGLLALELTAMLPAVSAVDKDALFKAVIRNGIA
jgi:hypothetical protein